MHMPVLALTGTQTNFRSKKGQGLQCALIDWRLTCSWRQTPATAEGLDLAYDSRGACSKESRPPAISNTSFVVDWGKLHVKRNTATDQTSLS
jgi:hypothetical protein